MLDCWLENKRPSLLVSFHLLWGPVKDTYTVYVFVYKKPDIVLSYIYILSLKCQDGINPCINIMLRIKNDEYLTEEEIISV